VEDIRHAGNIEEVASSVVTRVAEAASRRVLCVAGAQARGIVVSRRGRRARWFA